MQVLASWPVLTRPHARVIPDQIRDAHDGELYDRPRVRIMNVS